MSDMENTVETPRLIRSLAFRVVPGKDGLFAPEILLLEDNTVVKKRKGTMTTLGHAIAGADDLMDGWAFSEIEIDPVEYFTAVLL